MAISYKQKVSGEGISYFFARVISRVFGFVPVMSFLTIVMTVKSGLSFKEAFPWLFSVFFIVVLIPSVFALFSLYTGRISDLDLTDRKERIPLIFFALFCVLIELGLLVVWGAPKIFIAAAVLFLSVGIIFGLITLFWKISGHAAAAGALFIITNYFFNFRFWWIIFLAPVIMWARWKLKKHDVPQLLAGFTLMVVICLVVFNLFDIVFPHPAFKF